jgi:hypothetical protein
LSEMQDALKGVKDGQAALKNEIVEAIKEFMEGRAVEAGQLTKQGMADMLDEFAHNQREQVLAEVQQRLPGLMVAAPVVPAPPVAIKRDVNGRFFYTADGVTKWWDVGPDFVFPKKTTLQLGWPLWFKGIPSSQTMPFRCFQRKHLPKAHHSQFSNWAGLFKKMERGLKNVVPAAKDVDTTYLTDSFEEGTAHLQASGMSYAFPHATEERPKAKKAKKWTVQNWYQGSKQAQIKKFGTAADKSFLATFLQNSGSHLHKSRKRKAGAGAGEAASKKTGVQQQAV